MYAKSFLRKLPMKPLERNVALPISYFLIALFGAENVIIPTLNHGNIYFIIAFAFVSIVYLFLGICYFTPLFSKKWFRLLQLIAACIMFISIMAASIIIHQMGILKTITILHITFFIISSIILLFNCKTLIRNKFLWIIFMFLIPLAGCICFLIWRNQQFKQNTENLYNVS